MKLKKLFIAVCAVALALPLFSGCDDGESSSDSAASILVAYIANQDTVTTNELYVANPGAADSGSLVSGPTIVGNVATTPAPKWSPNRSKIAFVADKNTPGALELYVADANAEPTDEPIKLNATNLAGGEAVTDFEWSPNGSYIAFISTESGQPELYIANPGTANSGNLINDTVNTAVASFEWAPNSSRIAYLADEGINLGQYRLFTILPSGNPASKETVNTSLSNPSCTVIDIYDWSPDSTRIAYVAANNTAGIEQVHIANYDGQQNNQASSVATSGAGATAIAWSPDGSMLAYIADDSIDSLQELYVVTEGANGQKKVCDNPISGVLPDIQWSPNSSMIAFRADMFAGGQYELFNTYVDTFETIGTDDYFGKIYTINGNFPSTIITTLGPITRPLFAWTSNSSQIVYQGILDLASQFEIEIADIDGSDRVRLNNSLPPTFPLGVYEFEILPNSSRVIYQAIQDIDNAYELYSVTLDGKNRSTLNGSLIFDPTIGVLGTTTPSMWGCLPNSSRVVYVADQDEDDVFELYSVTPTGTSNLRLNPDTLSDTGGDIVQIIIPE